MRHTHEQSICTNASSHMRHTHEQSICTNAKSIVFLKKKKNAKNIVTQLKFSDIFNRDIHNLNLPSFIVVIELFFFF